MDKNNFTIKRTYEKELEGHVKSCVLLNNEIITINYEKVESNILKIFSSYLWSILINKIFHLNYLVLNKTFKYFHNYFNK